MPAYTIYRKNGCHDIASKPSINTNMFSLLDNLDTNIIKNILAYAADIEGIDYFTEGHYLKAEGWQEMLGSYKRGDDSIIQLAAKQRYVLRYPLILLGIDIDPEVYAVDSLGKSTLCVGKTVIVCSGWAEGDISHLLLVDINYDLNTYTALRYDGYDITACFAEYVR
jgi:hypothetical protein